jgi:hypothetical protein
MLGYGPGEHTLVWYHSGRGLAKLASGAEQANPTFALERRRTMKKK